MDNKIIILFKHSSKKFPFTDNAKKKLENNFLKVILYEDILINKVSKEAYKEKNLNIIQTNYEKLGINLKLEKIYKINLFLKKIREENQSEKIFVSPSFVSNYTDEDYIFYELSRNYSIQFIRPERCFIKNRFILAKNVYKHQYILKKKTNFLDKEFNIFKKNYASSLEDYSENLPNRSKASKTFLNKMLTHLLKLIFKFKFNEKPKKYALAILGNSKNLKSISEINLKNFVNKFLDNFDYELVFLVHPHTIFTKYLLDNIKKKNIFFKSKRIIFMQSFGNLDNLIVNSEFIIHLTSSLSAQSLFKNKKILCLGKNVAYLNIQNNLINNFNINDFDFLKKEINQNDFLIKDGFIVERLKNSVNHLGKYKLYLGRKNYLHQWTFSRHMEKIVQSLLNAI